MKYQITLFNIIGFIALAIALIAFGIDTAAEQGSGHFASLGLVLTWLLGFTIAACSLMIDLPIQLVGQKDIIKKNIAEIIILVLLIPPFYFLW